MVLVGKTGSGKSATGNTILGKKAFRSILDFSSETEKCEKETAKVDGRILAAVDTPGLYDTKKSQEEVKTEIARCISFIAPGPHVFLVVIKPGRFTEEEQNTVNIIQKIFGENAAAYTMVVFTHGDILEEEGSSIDKLIHKCPALHAFLKQCGGGFIVLNNKNKDLTQVRQLLEKIDVMLLRNGGSYYNNEMLQEARKAILESMVGFLKENLNLRVEELKGRAERHNKFLQSFCKAHRASSAVVAGTSVGALVGIAGGPVGVAIGAGVGAAVGGVCAAALAVKDNCVIQ